MNAIRPRRRSSAALVGAVAAAACLTAPAQATVTCAVNSTPLAFGAFSSLETGPHDTDATITVSCSSDAGSETATYDIALDGGGSGSMAPRKMASGGNLLRYNIYAEPTRTSVWGDGSGGGSAVPDTLALNDANQTYSHGYTAYGRIEAGQTDAPIGSYADLVTITLTY